MASSQRASQHFATGRTVMSACGGITLIVGNLWIKVAALHRSGTANAAGCCAVVAGSDQATAASKAGLCVRCVAEGYFIGCVPDGKRVKAHLLAANGHLELPHLRLKTVSEVRRFSWSCNSH
jgi:hypothetical protein